MLTEIARAHDSSVASVALAWVQAQPGVGSTIIGARRLPQLEENLKAASLRLTPDEISRLSTLTQPSFGFPRSMQPVFPSIHNGGTTVNGVHGPLSPFVIGAGEKPY